MSTENSATSSKSTRRQVRGERRMEGILQAAAQIFSEVGYERATTNAIAARAEVSPGTLYQFYRNKQEIAEALATRYSIRLKQAHDKAFEADPSLPMRTLVDHFVDPLLSFHFESPGFEPLFVGSAVSAELMQRLDCLHSEMLERLVLILSKKLHKTEREELRKAAEVCIHIFKGLMPYVLSADEGRRAERTSELKLVLEKYIESKLDGQAP